MWRVVAAVATIVGLAGCASTTTTVGDALDSALSATGSASLAVELGESGNALPTLVDTALSDALRQLEAATTTLEQGVPPADGSAEDRALWSDGLQLVRAATDAVLEARSGLAAGRSLDESSAALDEALDALREARERLQ
ncbi:MAG: hypothetical protein JWP85_2011 [Rhodoglobus sp.]|nr:hypothetical protein [Rhodoglobus sp.]